MGVHRKDRRGDDELLRAAACGDGAAFAVFYKRHLPVVVAYLRRRTAGPEMAADLTAEVFAAALVACPRYRPGEAPAVAWLLGVANNKLRESARRHRVAAGARLQLGLAEIAFVEDDVALVDELADAGALALGHLAELPVEQRQAVWRRIVDEKSYDRLARELDCSEALVRQRVSRGLRRLRARIEEEP